MTKKLKNEKGFSAVEFILILVIIILIGAVGYFVYKNHHKKMVAVVITKKTTVSVTPMNTAPSVIDTWTGSGTNSNWSNASNWNNGIPKTNYRLIFNLAPNTTNGGLNSNNDLTNLTLNSLIFEGGTPNAHGAEAISLTGDPISLSNGITDTSQADVSSTVAFNVSLTGSQTFKLNGNFGFIPTSSSNLASTNLDLGSNTLNLTGSDGISFNYLSGSGTLVVNSPGVTTVGQPSPNFTGLVKVESGMIAMDNDNSLGTATIDISNGATLRVVNSESSTDSISNPISMSGNGTNNSGAINIVTPLTQLTLTGKVTLNGNTGLGVYNSNNTNTGPGSFTFTQPVVVNNYNLAGLSSSILVNTP